MEIYMYSIVIYFSMYTESIHFLNIFIEGVMYTDIMKLEIQESWPDGKISIY